LHETGSRLAVRGDRCEPALVVFDARIEQAQVLEQLVDHLTGQLRQRLGGACRTPANLDGALREHDTELGHQAADAVDGRGALFDITLARPVQREDRLLLDTLYRDKAHVGPRDRLADRVRIHCATVSTSFARLTVFLSTTRPSRSTPCTENTFFAKSIPTVVIFSMTSPLVLRLMTTALQSWHLDAVRFHRNRVGEVPFIRQARRNIESDVNPYGVGPGTVPSGMYRTTGVRHDSGMAA
jgi:hypothetical protein